MTVNMSIHNVAGVIADLGPATFTNPDVLVCANGYPYRGAFPLGEPLAKQPAIDGLGKSGSTHLDAASIALPKEFNRLIDTQKIRAFSSNIIAAADQCLKN